MNKYTVCINNISVCTDQEKAKMNHQCNICLAACFKSIGDVKRNIGRHKTYCASDLQYKLFHNCLNETFLNNSCKTEFIDKKKTVKIFEKRAKNLCPKGEEKLSMCQQLANACMTDKIFKIFVSDCSKGSENFLSQSENYYKSCIDAIVECSDHQKTAHKDPCKICHSVCFKPIKDKVIDIHGHYYYCASDEQFKAFPKCLNDSFFKGRCKSHFATNRLAVGINQSQAKSKCLKAKRLKTMEDSGFWLDYGSQECKEKADKCTEGRSSQLQVYCPNVKPVPEYFACIRSIPECDSQAKTSLSRIEMMCWLCGGQCEEDFTAKRVHFVDKDGKDRVVTCQPKEGYKTYYDCLNKSLLYIKSIEVCKLLRFSLTVIYVHTLKLRNHPISFFP